MEEKISKQMKIKKTTVERVELFIDRNPRYSHMNFNTFAVEAMMKLINEEEREK